LLSEKYVNITGKIGKNLFCYLENDITRPQPQTYKIINNLNKEVKEAVRVDFIPHETWLNYSQNLWSQCSETFQIPQSNNFDTETITLHELVIALKI
jgi:hypothetical protein